MLLARFKSLTMQSPPGQQQLHPHLVNREANVQPVESKAYGKENYTGRNLLQGSPQAPSLELRPFKLHDYLYHSYTFVSEISSNLETSIDV
jgi:hypothetical protein